MKNIFRNYDKMNATEIKILQYIIKNIDEIQKITVKELSQRLFVSKTTIINLAKKLGYEGFSELRFFLKNISERKTENQEEHISEKNDVNDIFEEMSHEINRTLMIQDREEIEEVVKKIIKSRIVYIISRGGSVHTGEYLNSRLAACKIKSIFISDINLINAVIENVLDNEMIIFLSQSGTTRTIVDMALKANLMGIETVAITSFGKNELQKYCTNSLYFYANETDTKKNDVISRVGMNIVTQLLIEYIKKDVNQ
jgi:hypothetical protein